ncbi:hypothetical protein B6S59_29125 [Pseudomonas sp. A46]|nr:hypothetical protein B6S59_29125 [Pseudomonas sp. A46]
MLIQQLKQLEKDGIVLLTAVETRLPTLTFQGLRPGDQVIANGFSGLQSGIWCQCSRIRPT